MPPLDPARIEALLGGDPFVRRLVYRASVDSTNDLARELAEAGAPEGTVVFAERQTAGRGRHARPWHSPAGVGLYVTILLRPGRPENAPSRWTIAASVAACEACRRLSARDVTIRWPNDLYWDGRKIAGTLAETRSVGSTLGALVLGTGFNVNHGPEDFPPELRERAGSLRMAAGGRPLDREGLAALYLCEFGSIARDLAAGEWNRVVSRWARLAPEADGRRVRVGGGPVGAFEGTTRGIDASGALRVERAEGGIAIVRSDESLAYVEP